MCRPGSSNIFGQLNLQLAGFEEIFIGANDRVFDELKWQTS